MRLICERFSFFVSSLLLTELHNLDLPPIRWHTKPRRRKRADYLDAIKTERGSVETLVWQS
ncbi:hypothetical protein RHEC894_PC00085 (plasmid) [Rhizobium sp. CIAT894]|nr:hypothetical protein RHEC894_PC00085 [Rhizobium sp. CIAT894]